MNVVTTFVLQKLKEEQEEGNRPIDRSVVMQRARNATIAMAISPTNGLAFHSAVIDGMNAQRFNDFLAQTIVRLLYNSILMNMLSSFLT